MAVIFNTLPSVQKANYLYFFGEQNMIITNETFLYKVNGITLLLTLLI